MIPTITRSDRFVLAVSLACFGVAGLANTSITAGGRSLVGAAFAIGGVYGVARYAQRVSKPTLARLALVLWLAFIGIAGIHTLGLESVAATVPGQAAAIVTVLIVLTWSTLIGAVAATTFLAFREYTAGAETAVPDESVLEQEYDL